MTTTYPFDTEPQTKDDWKEPYSSQPQTDYNLKPRLVRCLHCKYEIESNLAGPRCGICHYSLLTVTS